MYLRLKPSASDPSKSERQPDRPTLSPSVYNTLVEQNTDSFDWIHGGQPGPIKFLDCHQFEYAAMRAGNGDDSAVTMINLYLNGIGRLVVPEHGGVPKTGTIVGPASLGMSHWAARRRSRSRPRKRCLSRNPDTARENLTRF